VKPRRHSSPPAERRGEAGRGGTGQRARPASVALPRPAEVIVTRLGSEADGLALHPDGAPLYLPYTLPGETVRATPTHKRGDGWASTAEILASSPDRVAAPCRHFGTCGGCTLQHWAEPAYTAWKLGLLQAALHRAGYPAPTIAPLQHTRPTSRRRMDLAIRRIPNGIAIGLHAQRSATIVDITECHVLHPALVALAADLRDLLHRLGGLKREGSAVVNLLDSGPDLLLRTDAPLTTPDRTRLADFARVRGLPRITTQNGTGPIEPAAALRPATTMLSGTLVTPPPGAFLQASAEGEAAIVAAVLAGLPDKLPAKARIADLYAGCGTLTFALARYARVAAYEGDAPSAVALREAANHSGQAGRVEAYTRDLARQPLADKELSGFAAIVLDPPHAGAEAQVARITASTVKRVIYVSCNPAALARDAALLRQAGFGLLSATPIDQFLWSARLESVCVFSR